MTRSISRDTYLGKLANIGQNENEALKGAKACVIKAMSKESLALKADRVIAAKDLQELAAIAAQRRTGQGGTKSLAALRDYLKDYLKKNPDADSEQTFGVTFGGQRITQRGLRHLAAFGAYKQVSKEDHTLLEKRFAKGGGETTREGYRAELRNKYPQLTSGGADALTRAKECLIEKMPEDFLGLNANAIIEAKDMRTLCWHAAQCGTDSDMTRTLKDLADFLTNHKQDVNPKDFGLSAWPEKIEADGLLFFAHRGVYKSPLSSEEKSAIQSWFTNPARDPKAQVQSYYAIPSLTNQELQITQEGELKGSIRFPPDGADLNVEKTLGKGGFGAVMLCKDSNDNQFAVKRMEKPPLAPEIALIELNATKSLDHPNIAKYHACAMSKDRKSLYIQMEYIDGITMEKHIANNRKPSAELFQKQGLDLVKGMIYKTEQKFYVRDLKPDNVMVDKNGTLKLIDHGLDVFGGNLNASQPVGLAGTAGFFVPEVITKEYKPDVDKFNAYATCVNLAMMRLGMTTKDLQNAIIANNKPMAKMLLMQPQNTIGVLSKQLQAISPQDKLPVDAVILQGLNIDPAKRPTMQQIADAFSVPGGNA